MIKTISPGLLVASAFLFLSCEKQTPPDGGSTEPPSDPVKPAPPVEAPAPVEPTPQPAAEPAPESLNPGDKVSLSAVQAATWIQGAAPVSFEPGHVYIFECWATWCGPCIRSIPHLNELHKKYAEKGLHLHGMHIFEKGDSEEALEKAKQFVASQGEGMQYPVAFASRDSQFNSHWVKPAKVRGIPHAFIVVDGVLKMTTHPARIDDKLIETLLKGGEEAEKFIKTLSAATTMESKSQQALQEFRRAAMTGNVEEMEKHMQTLKGGQVPPQVMETMEMDMLIARKDWPKVEEIVSSPSKGVAFNYLCSRVGMPGTIPAGIPEDLFGKLAEGYAKEVAGRPQPMPVEYISLSGLQFRAGNKDLAITTAKEGEALAAKDPKRSQFPLPVYEKYRMSLEEGSVPDSKTFSSWIREEMTKNR